MNLRFCGDWGATLIREPSAQGLTLLELLLTLAIFSAVIGLLLNSFVQLKRQNEKIQTLLTLRQEARNLEKLLKEDISAAVYLKEFMTSAQAKQERRKSGILGVSESDGEFDSDAIHMHVRTRSRFLRMLPFGNDPELHEVSYYLDTIGDPRLFKRREELYIDSDITEGDRSIVHPLSQRVISFDIKYYEGTKSEELEDWDSEDKKGSLPAGLKITIILEGEKGKTLKSEFHINIRPAMGPFVNWKT